VKRRCGETKVGRIGFLARKIAANKGLAIRIILVACSIQDAIAAKREAYDFLRGDEEYKYRFGAKNTNIYELHLRK
jgi:hypothetical protein